MAYYHVEQESVEGEVIEADSAADAAKEMAHIIFGEHVKVIPWDERFNGRGMIHFDVYGDDKYEQLDTLCVREVKGA